MTGGDREDRFGIFLTEYGLRHINTEMEVRIMNILSVEDVALADLSKLLDAPASTVLFNVNKLAGKKLITSYRDDIDRRKTYYRMTSIKIVSSVKPDPEMVEPEMHRVEILVDRFGWFKEKIEYTNLISSKMGVNFGPALEVYNYALANGMRKKFKDCSHETVVNHIIEYLNRAGVCPITLESRKPLTVSVHRACISPTHQMCISSCGLHLMCRALEICTASPFNVKQVDGGGSDHLFYEIYPCKRSSYSNESYLDGDGLLSVKGDAENFCLVTDADGCSHLLDNEVQIKIVQCLDRLPCTLKMLTGELDISSSTVFSNMTKLEEMRIISTNRDMQGPNHYSNCGIIILQRSPLRTKEFTSGGGLIAAAIDDPSQYYVSMFKHFLLTFESASIDTGKFQNYLRKKFLRATIGDGLDLSVDEIITGMCREDKLMGSKLRLVSFIPLTLRVTSEGFSKFGAWAMAEFYVGAIMEAVLFKTNRRYTVTEINEKTSNGTSSFEFVMEPDGHTLRALSFD